MEAIFRTTLKLSPTAEQTNQKHFNKQTNLTTSFL